MSPSDAKKKVFGQRLRNAARTTLRASEGAAIGNSQFHQLAFELYRTAMNLVRDWRGSLEEIELHVREAEADISAAMADADAKVSLFPAGTASAMGHTSGFPSVERNGSACHGCGKTVSLVAMIDAIGSGPKAVFLTLDAGSDVLLFAMHRYCWLEQRRAGKYSLLREVPKEEWFLLLAAKDVLSS